MKKMDKDLKKIWMAVIFSVAILMLFAGFIELTFWADKKIKTFVAQKATEQKKMAREKESCQTSDLIVEYGDEVIILDCKGKEKKRMTRKEWDKVNKNSHETSTKRKIKGEAKKISVTSPQEKLNCDQISLKNGNWSQNNILREACRMSDGDRDFVLTMLAENPKVDPTLVSPRNRDGSFDHGLLQFNSRWHKEFVFGPSFRYWDKQLEYGLKLYKKNPNTFNGYKVRHRGLVFLQTQDA